MMAKCLFAIGGVSEKTQKIANRFIKSFTIKTFEDGYSIAWIEDIFTNDQISIWFDLTEKVEQQELSWRSIIITDIYDEIEESSYEFEDDNTLLDVFGIETNITKEI
jgi:hypothetical protein